jgi:uncharacterized protein (TIGR03435 family)
MNNIMRRFSLVIILTTAVTVISLRAQAPSAQKVSFEVASIKRNTSGLANGGLGPRGNRVTATNVPLKTLLLWAYTPEKGRFLTNQIIGGPDWISTDRFDIQATAAEGAAPTSAVQMRLMMQSLLADRFQLKVHRDVRDLPVYNLVIIKSGPKLSADQTPPDPRQAFINFASPGESSGTLPRGAMREVQGPSGTTLVGTAITMELLVSLLQGQSDRLIIDKTDFKNLFDINIQFSRNMAETPDATASLFTAIQDIGLKLESAKTSMEVVVIDSVQKPTEN